MPELISSQFYSNYLLNHKAFIEYLNAVAFHLMEKTEHCIIDFSNTRIYTFNIANSIYDLMLISHPDFIQFSFNYKTSHKTDSAFQSLLDTLTQHILLNQVEQFHDSLRYGTFDFTMAKVVSLPFSNKKISSFYLLSQIQHSISYFKSISSEIKQIIKFDLYDYHIHQPFVILEGVTLFKKLHIPVSFPFNSLLKDLSVKYAHSFHKNTQTEYTQLLAAIKKTCIAKEITSKSKKFEYNDSEYSVYYNTQYKALVFSNINVSFVAFSLGNDSWRICHFNLGNGYRNLTYFFKNQSTFNDLTLIIHSSKFMQIGSFFNQFNDSLLFYSLFCENEAE